MARYNLQNLFSSKIIKQKLLNKGESVKKTYQIILDISEANMDFVPGDCLGVLPENDPKLVNLCIQKLNSENSHKIVISGINYTLEEYLLKKANISKLKTALFKLFLEKLASFEKKEKLSHLLSQKELLNNYIQNHELEDFLDEFYSSEITSQEICENLLPMLPRLYSISSAKCLFSNEIHLTVSYLEYETSNKKRHGVCSHYLCKLAKDNVKIYIHPTHRFFLPQNDSSAIIMIATGAGIAPYLSFLQHRHFHQARGANWLFFGERNESSDFYYKDYLNNLKNENFLKITTAFSRDQKEKIYVQHRILEKQKEIWHQLKEGAYIYVCGDAKKMAKDVEKALLLIFQNMGNLSEKQALDYLQLLMEEKRYLKDVY